MYGTIRSFRLLYETTPDRQKKVQFIQEIYSSLQSQGLRFVLFEQATGACFVASHEAAKSKIGHSMRYQIKMEKKRRAEANDDASNNSVISIFTDETLESVLGEPGLMDFPNPVPDLDLIDAAC